jgi:hypothetical protein
MKVIGPKSSDSCEFIIVEDANAVRRPKQTVPNNYFRKITKALFFGQPLFKWVFEDVSSDFNNWTKLLKLPFRELMNNALQKLLEKHEKL